jgi:hypothetical protein
MAITTLDGVIAGMLPPYDYLKVGGTMEAAGILSSHLLSTGAPGAAAAPTPGLTGAVLTTYAGQIPFVNPNSGNTYLSRLSCASTGSGVLMLLDRLWHNSGFTMTTTTAETITSATLPARCVPASGSTPDTNGGGIMAALEVYTATGNGSPITNTTLSYTNQAGTASQTATMASFPATAAVGTFVPFQLAAGDTGIRAVASLTKGTSYVSGTMGVVLYRKIAQVEVPTANMGNAIDALTSGFPRLYDNSVPFLVWMPTSTTAVNIMGTVNFAQG